MTRYPSLTRPVLTCAILSLVTLTSCATRTSLAVPTDKVAVQAFRPIYWSKKDTDKTIAQIKEHNAAYKAVSGKSDKLSLTFKERWFEGTPLQVTAFR
jgi:type IV pilus biogenesis protein CpaD/CtpE